MVLAHRVCRSTSCNRLWHQAAAQQVRERRRIDRIRLHLGIRDRFQQLGVRQVKVDPRRRQQIPQPVPAPSGFHHRLVRPWPLAEER
jgi:hypothetical protein